MSKYYFISEPSQFDELKYGDAFESICGLCGNKWKIEKFIKSKLEKYKLMMCGRCRKSYIQKNKSPEEKAKIILERKSTLKERYGDENYNNRDQASKTCLKRYNSTSPLGNENIYKETQNTRFKLYGSKNYVETVGFRIQKAETQLKLYGDPNYTNREQACDTLEKKYGVRNSGSRNVDKMLESRKTTCGSVSVTYKYIYYGIRLDSSWELAVWIYCVDHNIPITRNPSIIFKYCDMYGNFKEYAPDFLINSKLVEIKGSQFFRPDGTMCFPYTKMHHNSELLTQEEKSYWDDLYERKRQCGLANGVEFWRESDCEKYIDYCNVNYPGWKETYRKDNFYNPSYWCFNIINPGYYQPMYYVPTKDKGVSPYNMKPDSDGFVIPSKSVNPYDVGLLK